MSKSHRYDAEYQPRVEDIESELFFPKDRERSRQRLAVRRGIEDYFERQHLKSIDDDWYDDE